MPDISEELYTIANDPYGKNVKQAIYDALYKVNQAKIEPSGDSQVVGNAVVVARGLMRYNVGTGYLILPGNYDFWQETNDDVKESATLTASLREDGLLIAAVMHRDENVSISSEGWTLVKKSQPASVTDTYQWISVWAKQASSGNHSVTITPGSNARISLKLIVLYDTQSLTVVDDIVLPSSSYIPPDASGKRRLYMISSIYASDSIAKTYEPSNFGSLNLQEMLEKRFMVWYDYQPELQTTPTFNYKLGGYDANTSSALVFDIEEG